MRVLRGAQHGARSGMEGLEIAWSGPAGPLGLEGSMGTLSE